MGQNNKTYRVTRRNRPSIRLYPQCTVCLLTLGLLLSGALSACGPGAPSPTATVPLPTPTLTSLPGPANPAYWPTKGWRTSTPEEQGVDSAQLLGALRHIGEERMNVRTMMVIRNGYIVLEAANQPYTLDARYQVYSVTKSVMGMLIGIAIKEGYIKDVNQTVLGFFPERTIATPASWYPDKEKETITIEDLLTMQPGLDCADEKLNFAMEASKDWVQFALDLPMASPPGRTLVYCTAGPHILSAILSKATGMSTQAYAQSRLFGPLGIDASEITWQTDPQGIAIGGYGIAMKPRDMAKLGLLYLYDGKWEGRQIVPEEWVATSTRAHAFGANHKDYGYLFWVYPDHYAAEGLGEQKIMVVKDRNMVVVMTSAIDWHETQPLENVLEDYVIPAATSSGPLPPNPQAFTSLHGRIQYMANPVQVVQPLSAVARAVSGKTYSMQDNPLGWKSLTLSFSEGSAEAHAVVELANGASTITQTVAIGMDNVYRVEGSLDANFTARRGYWDEGSGEGHTLIVTQIQSSPDLQEEKITADFSGDTLRAKVQETVFGTYSYDLVGTSTSPTSSPTPTTVSPQEPVMSLPEEGASVILPVHVLAHLGEPDQKVRAVLRWQDGTKLTNDFTLLRGEDDKGLLIDNLDWVNMLQPPEPKTQGATLEILDANGSRLLQRNVTVLSPNDANTEQVRLFWTVSGAPDIVQPQVRRVIKTEQMATTAIEEMLWGPPATSQVGFGTALPMPPEVLAYHGRQPGWGPRVNLIKLTIDNGVATADFSKEMRAYGGGSLRVKQIRDQIAQTLEQFPAVHEVRIAIEGQTEGILEP